MSIQHIDIQQFHTTWESDHTLLIDVREADEYAEGHVPGAQNIPLQNIVLRANTLPSEQPIYLICRSGMRSGNAAKELMKRDDTLDLINIKGGTMAWINAGHATNKGLTP